MQSTPDHSKLAATETPSKSVSKLLFLPVTRDDSKSCQRRKTATTKFIQFFIWVWYSSLTEFVISSPFYENLVPFSICDVECQRDNDVLVSQIIFKVEVILLYFQSEVVVLLQTRGRTIRPIVKETRRNVVTMFCDVPVWRITASLEVFYSTPYMRFSSNLFWRTITPQC